MSPPQASDGGLGSVKWIAGLVVLLLVIYYFEAPLRSLMGSEQASHVQQIASDSLLGKISSFKAPPLANEPARKEEVSRPEAAAKPQPKLAKLPTWPPAQGVMIQRTNFSSNHNGTGAVGTYPEGTPVLILDWNNGQAMVHVNANGVVGWVPRRTIGHLANLNGSPWKP